MIILDTHIRIWWVHGSPQMPQDYRDYVQEHEAEGLGVSAISCWEVAKLVEGGRVTLPLPVGEWLTQALAYPGVRLLDLSPQVAVASTQLPGRRCVTTSCAVSAIGSPSSVAEKGD